MALFAAGLSSAGATDPDSWQQFRSRWDSARTWSAEFTQRLDLGDGAPALESRGRVLLSKPGRIRWEYDGAPGQLVVGDGDWLWIYQAGLEQVYKISYGQSLVHTMIATLVGGPEPLDNAYEVSQAGTNARGHTVFRLQPKDGSGPPLELAVAPGAAEPSSVVVVEAAGGRNELTFTDSSLDLPLGASLFNFTPPPGTDVITGQ